MAEPISSATLAIKGGAMLATGGVVAELVIFNDGIYAYLAITGAVVSMFGVLHEVLKNRPIKHTITQIVSEMAKGLMLGVMAIPFWYLVLSTVGETLIQKLFDLDVGGIGNSVWLMVSFALSWYTVPIFDWFVSKIKVRSSNV